MKKYIIILVLLVLGIIIIFYYYDKYGYYKTKDYKLKVTCYEIMVSYEEEIIVIPEDIWIENDTINNILFFSQAENGYLKYCIIGTEDIFENTNAIKLFNFKNRYRKINTILETIRDIVSYDNVIISCRLSNDKTKVDVCYDTPVKGRDIECYEITPR